MLDAAMHLRQNPDSRFLLGAVDEISAYNYNIDLLAGWYKTSVVTLAGIYQNELPGSYPGEGSAMFIVDNKKRAGSVKVEALQTITSDSPQIVAQCFRDFLDLNDLNAVAPGLFMSGENGDNRMMPFYEACEKQLTNVPVARFKHISGEFATASSIALWLAAELLRTQEVPSHMLKYGPVNTGPKEQTGLRKILIYNNYKFVQHSFILCSVDH